MSLEQVVDFKYLDVNINIKNTMHRKIKERIVNENKCYFSINKVLRLKLLSKITLYTRYLRPIVTYA